MKKLIYIDIKFLPNKILFFILGNHECVSVINNYVQKEDVYYFTRKQPLETEAKLPSHLAKPIHNLVMSVSSR